MLQYNETLFSQPLYYRIHVRMLRQCVMHNGLLIAAQAACSFSVCVHSDDALQCVSIVNEKYIPVPGGPCSSVRPVRVPSVDALTALSCVSFVSCVSFAHCCRGTPLGAASDPPPFAPLLLLPSLISALDRRLLRSFSCDWLII